jgi:hypothetical protein
MSSNEKDRSKFVFSETFNNKNGKSSGSGFIGVILGMLTAASFIAGMTGWWLGKEGVIEILEIILKLGFLSGLLLGVRKVTGGFEKDNHEKPGI